MGDNVADYKGFEMCIVLLLILAGLFVNFFLSLKVLLYTEAWLMLLRNMTPQVV